MKISLHLRGVYPILCKSYYCLLFKAMSFEDEMEAIEREEWLAKFDDKQVMNAARMFFRMAFIICLMIGNQKSIQNLHFNYESTTRTITKTAQRMAK